MIFVAADSTVVKLAFAEPVASPTADLNNNTTPPSPPTPVPPPEEPQRPVEPGTITQGWDNSSFTPSGITEHRDVFMQNSSNRTSYETTYGDFVLDKSSPGFARFLSPGPDPQEIAQTAFLVLYQGLTLLSPANSTIDNVTSDGISIHYGLYLAAALAGTMTVNYSFLRDTNKVTISFSPVVGLPDQYQIVWLTFTSWDAVDTAYPADIEQRFADLDGRYGEIFLGLDVGTVYGTGTIDRPGAIIRPEKILGSPGGPSIRLDVSDAPADFNASYAGELNFSGHRGNAVLSTFLPGHLSIDPFFLYSGQPQDATAYSGVQRKTFFDGTRYWLFFKASTGYIDYKSTLDGKTWSNIQIAAIPGSWPSPSLGFTVISYGRTVGVLWTDGTDLTRVHIRTGLMSEDAIQWDDSGVTGRQLPYPCCTYNVNTPVSATFTSQGKDFAITWSDTGGGLGTQFYECTGPGSSGFSSCATQAAVGSTDWVGLSGDHRYSLVVAFNGVDDVARIMVNSYTDSPHPNAQHSKLSVKVFRADGTTCGDSDFGDTGQDIRNSWTNDGLFTATASGNLVNVFYVNGATARIVSFNIDSNCAGHVDVVQAFSVSAKYLTVGTEGSGALYLFYSQNGAMYYARTVPDGSNTWKAIPILSSYTSPYYLTAAQYSGHFIPLVFTRAYAANFDSCTSSWCLYYVGFPLPLDGEAAVNNPWATKFGEPLVSETGGVVSPTIGLLASGHVLIGGKPAISIIYKEPGLFGLDGSNYAPLNERYQIIPGIYYDLPWIAGSGWSLGIVHMTGGQEFAVGLTGASGTASWYNNTKGVRFTLKFDTSGVWTLTFASGAYMTFTYTGASAGNLTRAYLDTTGQNYLTYVTTPGQGTAFNGTIMDSSTPSRTIGFSSDTGVNYGNGQTVAFVKTLGGWSAQGTVPACSGTSTDSGKLQITDAIGRVTTFWVCQWKLFALDSPNGGRVIYTYATTPISQGTEAYSYPVTLIDVYNESAAAVKARSRVFSWTFMNGEVTRALVNTTDKSAVVQGSNEYIFNPSDGTASVRTYDSAGQVLYYDLETLNSGKMKDLSGNANDGTISGMANIYGVVGKAQDTGTAGYIQVADKPSLNPTTAISISAWFKPGTSSSQYRPIVQKYSSGGYLLTLDTNVGGKLRWFVYKDSTNAVAVASDSVPASGVWTHVVAVAQAGGKMQMYINGLLQADVKDLPSIYGSVGYDFFIGTWGSDFVGSIDELRIFNRALSAEDAVSLYTKNSLKRGEQRNWYSVNDMPHLVEGFVGDETSPSVVTSDAIDDWGNQIYSRDASGNETFASYANTNHQGHFYAPGRLDKITSGPTFNTEFIDFGNGLFPTGQGTWTVTIGTGTGGSAALDYSWFDKITPSLKIVAPSSGTTKVVHPLGATSPRFVEFKARVGAVEEFQARLGTSSTDYFKVRFGTDGYISFWISGGWTACGYYGAGTQLYTANAWYRFTFEFDMGTSPYAWKAYVNGIDMTCGSQSLGTGASLTQLALETVTASGSAWVDDIKMYANTNGVQSGFSALSVGFDGLQSRQSIALVAENGTIIDQAMQTGTGTLWLSFNSALTGTRAYYENGDSAKSTVRIYAEDGTIEYQSPLTRFFVGERYTYTRPRAFADELVKTRNGALYWQNPGTNIYADDACPSGATCDGLPAWVWQQSPNVIPMRGTSAHFTTFGYGVRWHRWYQTTGILTPDYFATYIRIPTGKTPDGIGLIVSGGTGWKQVYWGAYVNDGFSTPTYSMGPVPAARDQWIQLVVNDTDLGLGGYWYGFGYELAGGEADWDVTTTQTIGSWSYASLAISGLPSGVTVGVYYATNNTLIGTGAASSGVGTVSLFARAKGITSFPVKANIKIYDGTNEYYFGPARDVWPGDSFQYLGPSSFFDSKSSGVSYWPSSTVHTSSIGSKKFSGDCSDSALCYDMETVVEGPPALDSGIATPCLQDLSGKNNCGRWWGASSYYPTLSAPSTAAAGLGAAFAASQTTYISAADSSSLKLGTGAFTLSAWFRASTLPATGATYEILGKRVSSSGNYEIQLSNTAGITKVLAYVGDSAGSVGVTSNVTVSPNTLYHVVFRRLGASGTLSLWLNGAIGASTTTSTKNTDSTSALEIGRDPATATEYFDGTIDQVVLYKTGLSNTQILALYQTRLPGAPQIYLQPTNSPAGSGLIRSSRVPYEGTYLYASATYDAQGHVTSVTDVGRGLAIAIDAPSDDTASIASGGGTMSWTHTPVGNPSLVTVSCIGHDGNGYTFSGTYGGSSMTSAVSNNGVSSMTTFILYLNSPPVGAQTVAVTLGSGWTGGRLACSATTWTGTDGVDASLSNSAFNGAGTATSQALSVGGLGTVPPNEIFLTALGRYAAGTSGDTVSGTGAAASIVDNNVAQGIGTGYGCIFAGNSYYDCIASAQLRSSGTQIAWSWTPAAYEELVGIGIVSRYGGPNATYYEYAALDSGDYLTKLTRPFVSGDTGSGGRPVYYAYDFQSGVTYGTLDVDCRRSRTQYDAAGRPTQTSLYDEDPGEVFHLDMETFTSSSFKDVSCAGTADSRNGQATSYSGTTEVPGVDGVARNFALTSDYISAGDAASTRPQYVSVSAWIKTSSTANQWAVSKWISGSAANSHYLLVAHYTGITPNRPAFFVSNGVSTDYVATVSATINDGNWHFLAGTYDGTTISIYVDGRLDNSKMTTVGALQTTARGTALVVGQESTKTGVATMVGSVDDVRVFNRALTSSETKDLWGFKYKLLSRSSSAYDDMIAFPEFYGYPGASVTTYDGVSIPRSLYLDMETKKATINSVDYLEDLSGNGNHGKVTGTTSVAGKLGNARDFNSASDMITVTASPSLRCSVAFTVSAWINPDTLPASAGYGIVGKLDFTQSWRIWLRPDGKIEFDAKSDSVGNLFSTTALTTGGGWYHVVGTFDGVTATLYVNGVSEASASTADWGNTANVNIGIGKTDSTLSFDGQIDEVQIVPRALTSAEISSLYNGYGTGSFDASHLSRTYSDGLGRSVRQVTMNMYGAKIQSVRTLAWNDQPIYSYMPSGGYFTYTYDFLGRALTTTTPGGSLAGTSMTAVSEKARTIESVDAVGRKAYSKTDVMGRTVQTAVWNSTAGVYGNFTAAAYNALSEVVSLTDAKGQTTTTYYNSFGKPGMTVFPDGTYSVVYYDDNLRPYRTVDVMGITANFSYDSLGRVAAFSLKAPSGSSYDTLYKYDSAHDDLLTVENGTINWVAGTGTAKLMYTYDSLHRVKTEALNVETSPTFAGTVTYAYDDAGKVTDIQYPAAFGGWHAAYAYDSLGRPTEVDFGSSSPYPRYALLNYDSAGRLANVYYWKSGVNTTIQEHYAYDARDRVTQIKVYDGAGTCSNTDCFMQLDYTYDKASEMSGSTDNMYVNDLGTDKISNPKTVTYGYDGNGRMMNAYGPFGSSQGYQYQCYDYDQVGNIAHWNVSGSGSPTSCTTGTGPVVYTYHYAASPAWNKLTDIANLNSLSFTYNIAGSMATKSESSVTTTYTHDFLQQLAKVAVAGGTTYTYTYDGLGRRVKTYDGTTNSYFMSAGSKMLYSNVGGTETAWVYVGEKLLFRKEGTGATPEARYYHQDLSRNVRFISYYTTSVQTEAKYRYKLFGDVIVLKSPGTDPRFKFATQELDSNSDVRLYHMGARYLDPLVGRFIERDPIGPGYGYADNNPISFTDPSGLATVSWGTWGSNFQNLMGLSNVRMAITVTLAVVAVATAIPTGGGSLALYAAIAGGLIVGTIFVALTYVTSGGSATLDDYINAFALGFTIGAVIGGGAYAAFGVEGEAALAAGGREAVEQSVRAEAETVADAVQTGAQGERVLQAEATDVVSEESLTGSRIQYTEVSRSEIDDAIRGTGIRNQPEPLMEGNGAHKVIQKRAISERWADRAEKSLKGAGPNRGYGRLDLLDSENHIIFEIKPYHPGISPEKEYAAQTTRYSQAYFDEHGVVPTIRYILYTVVP